MFDSRTDAELRAIAKGIADGTIFTDRDLEFPEEVGCVFLVLVLMPPEVANTLMAAKPGLIFAPLKRALPNSAVGVPPQFLCADYLSEMQAAKVLMLAAEFRAGQAI